MISQIVQLIQDRSQSRSSLSMKEECKINQLLDDLGKDNPNNPDFLLLTREFNKYKLWYKFGYLSSWS